MPATLTLDTIVGSSLDVELFAQRHVIGGIVSGIDGTADPRQLLWEVINVLAANGYTFNPPTALNGHPNLILRHIRAIGISDIDARVALVYESPEFGTPSAYVIRRGTVLTSYQTDLLPGTRRPLRIPDTIVFGGATIPGDNVLFTFLKPLETIQISLLSYGQPRQSNGCVGKVNDAKWPPDSLDPSVVITGLGTTPQGYAPGYWMCSRWETAIAKWSGYYQLDAEAITRVDEDWSEYGVLVDTNTGKKVRLADEDATYAAASTIPYGYGIIYNDGGLIRVGPAHTTNFTTLFGF